MTMMGPSGVRSSFGPSARKGWGMSDVRMGGVGFGQTISLQEARKRIRALKRAVREKAHEMLMAAAEPLVATWKDNIAAEGWGPSSGLEELEFNEGEMTGREEVSESGVQSTGRYYNSIQSEVNSDLEVHVGSTIPRPSGRMLTTWSYPEALEYGTSSAQAYPTLRPALDESGPKMEKKSREVFEALAAGYLSGKYRSDL